MRIGKCVRNTHETQISVEVNLDGTGQTHVQTPIPFLSHMVEQLPRHGSFDLTVKCTGDVEIDGHHTTEDLGIVLGRAFLDALGDRKGITRYGAATLPMDEALVTVALDLSGRPFVVFDVPFGEVLPLGDPPFNPEMSEHFWQSFATAAGITLHVTKRAGVNTHHVVEATFKGVARCLRDAVRVEGRGVPSTKGQL